MATPSPAQTFILIMIIALITLCAIFSQSAFSSLSNEANNGTYNNNTDQQTYNQGMLSWNWIYVIALILIIAAIIAAFKYVQYTATQG